MAYLTLIELGINFLTPFLAGIKQAKIPVEIASAVENVLNQLVAHKQDVITKLNLEAQRG